MCVCCFFLFGGWVWVDKGVKGTALMKGGPTRAGLYMQFARR